MTKYFSVDISNDIHIINLCETLEQARETCLAGAAEAREFADDMDDYENYEVNDLPYAVYGVVLGKAECKKKKLTEEEKDERCSDFDYVLEKPKIVDYPKDATGNHSLHHQQNNQRPPKCGLFLRRTYETV